MEISLKKQLVENDSKNNDLFDDLFNDENDDSNNFTTGDLNLLMGYVTKVLEKYNPVSLPNANNDFKFIEYVDFAIEPLSTQFGNKKK